MKMKLLEDVDVDEVSPVRRAANRRKFVLKGDSDVDAEIQDIMQVAAPFEGAMLDGLRADGADETVQKAAVAAIRLLKGVEDELPDPLREMVAKLGNEMYPVRNPKLNSTTTEPNDPENELIGHASTGGELPTWKADSSAMCDDDDDDDDDVAKAFSEVSKRTYTADERKRMAEDGQAMPGGRYPIPDKGALEDAIHAVGRGKGSHAAIRAHIRSRAKALGATAMLPPNWSVAKADDEPDETLVRRILKALKGTQDAMTTPADENGDTSVPNDDPDDVAKAAETKEGGTVEPTAVPVLKEDGTWDLDGVPEAERRLLEPIAKAQADTMAALAETREALAKSQDALAEREFVHKAETELGALAAPTALGPVLKEAAEKLSPEANEALEQILKAANAQVETGDLFKELGRTALPDETGGGENAWAQIEKAAGALVEKDADGLTQSQAIANVLKTAEGAKLYARYQAEQYHDGAANLSGKGMV